MNMNTAETGRSSSMAEVDLERFLEFHREEDEIDFPHRTVDEILLLNDSSSSSSNSPSPPSSPSISSATATATATDWSELRNRSGNFGDYHAGPGLVPQLFGAVRSNAKPGAALAAAAAASRFVPAPRATAFRSSRSSPSSSDASFKVLESSPVSEAHSVHEDTGQVSPLLAEIDVVREQEEWVDGPVGTSQGLEDTHLVAADELLVDRFVELPSVDSASADDHLDDSPAGIQDSSYFVPSSANASAKFESEGEKFESDEDKFESSFIESKIESATNGTAFENEIITAGDSHEGELLDEDITIAVEQSDDLDSVIIPDDASNSGGNEEGGAIPEGIVSAIMDEFASDSRKTDNKSQPYLRPLELAEEHEKRLAFSGMHWEEGAAARPMRLEGLRTGSTMVGYFNVDAGNFITHTISSQAFRREHGFPMVIAVHYNYIALGMSKGLIMVTPSKYSPYNTDNMDPKTLMLGLQGDRLYVPVTSMCFNQQGDILFAGYGDGHYSVWDVQRVSVLKVITEHKAPVVHMLYLGQDVQNSRQFSVVSGDSSGVMKLIRFSIVPWVNRISYAKATKLLGEENSTVICASPLLSCDFLGGALLSSNGNTGVSTSAIGSMMGGVIGGDSGAKNSPADGVVIFVSHQSALVVKVSPMVDVYAQIPRPEGVGENSMPYAAWKYMSESNLTSTETTAVEGSETYSLLAIAWECKVQVAKLVKSKLTVYRKWTLESPATGVAWLDDQMLVVLTAAGQLCLFAKDGNMIHQTSYAIDGSRVDDLISYHTYFNNTYGNPERAHHNCLAVRGANIYILGPSHLVVSRLLPWKERINVLRAAGDWMGALGMALTIYDGHAHGVIDLPRSLDDVQKTVMPYLAELILYFVVEGFSYMEIASGNQLGISEKSDESKQVIGSEDPDIKEEYIRLGGSAVEFCVHIKRTDILFDEIFAKFCGAKHRETFLELLEPYILKDMLGSLPPEVMQALVEHYSSKGWLQRIEQCVLHMDISSLDFNQVVRLCREHRLHGALIYLFNKGLDDFTTPLEELLAVLRDCTRETAAELGYRILVYLKYCFKGLAFPPGHGTLSPIRLPAIRKELLQFLLRHSSTPNSWAVTNFPSNGPHPNLLHLLELDTEATLDVLGCALEENQVASSKDSTYSDTGSVEKEDRIVETHNLVQELVDVLSVILEMSNFHVGCCSDSDDDGLAMAWPSKKDVAHILEFIACYVSCQRAKVSRDILRELLEYLTSDFCLSPSGTFGTSKDRQTKLLNLLEVVPVADWDASNLLQMCEKAHFHQVCGFIHAIRHQYLASLDSYMKAFDEPVHAFSFIHYILKQTRDEESIAFRAEVIARIPDLLKLNRQGGFFLVFELFNGQGPLKMLSDLESHPESLFLYLKTLVEVNSSGTLDFSCLRKDGILDGTSGRKAVYQSDTIRIFLESLDEFLKILHDNPIHVTDEMTEIYLELLCRYERESVLKFLESLESYRVENCLRLCQDYGIIDAAAFLLERVGDVGSALSLILSGLNDKFVTLGDSVVKNLGSSDPGEFNLLLKQKEVKDLLDVVHSCIKLCQRNSPRLEPHESEFLWFQLLDSFCEPLMDSWSDKPKSTVETQMDFRDRSSPNQKDEVVEKITWKISKSHKFVNFLKKLFSMFIKEIVEGMIGYIRLPTIMLKLLTDNGSQEFGDFKLTILGMLGMYDFERRILDTAKSLIEDDTYYTMSLLKKGATHGCAPRSSVCCVCSSLLSKGPNSSSGLRVFSCGHAMHVLCELPETSGCPTCVPRKGTERSRSMFLLGNNGKASKSLVKSHQQPRMAAPHMPDHDAFENYGSHPFSRFELLHNLQKEQRGVLVENMPLLKLAPPAVYHEKVKKSNNFANGESSNGSSSIEGKTKKQQLKDLKVKGSSVRFPLRSSIFGKEKKGKQ